MTHQDKLDNLPVQQPKSTQGETTSSTVMNLLDSYPASPMTSKASDEGIIKLWADLDAIYPNRWIARMGLVAVDNQITHKAKVWQLGLRGLKREWVNKAILKLVDTNTGFIPELGEFRALCLEYAPREYFTPPVDDYQWLPVDEAKAKFSELKEILDGGL